jgi:hypothetical protein
MHRMPAIKEIEEDIDTKRKSAILSVRAFQQDCPHDKIVTNTLGSGARRICCSCGLEELNRYYSWPGETADGGLYEFIQPAGRRTILNSEFVKVGDVCSYRIRV